MWRRLEGVNINLRKLVLTRTSCHVGCHIEYFKEFDTIPEPYSRFVVT